MTPTALMVWFIAMVVMTTTVLVIGTLQASGLTGKEKKPRERGEAADSPEEPPQSDTVERRLAA